MGSNSDSQSDHTQTTTAAPQRQPVTAELRAWIIARAKAGITPDAVLQAMTASGWDEDVALHALETTLADHLAGDSAEKVDNQASALPEPVPVPEPLPPGAPLRLDAGDREVVVLALMRKPRIVLFGDLLSHAECDALIEAARPRLARSLTVEVKTGGEALNADRTSDGMFFTRGEIELIARIEQRIATLLGWPLERGEGLQILRYGPGAEYKPHYDYFEPNEPGTPVILKRGGQRVATLIIYLNEPEQGGATCFPDAQFEVAPRRGHAVFFSYERPHPSTRTLHGGAPVAVGEKWIATKWLREGRFD